MKRLSAAVAILLAAACGGSEAPATIQLFTAQPASIVLGGTTNLVIAAAPFDATLTIDNGVGDVTGKTSVAVTPGADTTYTLTATRKGSTVHATTSVSVGAAPASGFKVEATSAALVVAGAPAGYMVTALGPSGAVNAAYRGTVHFSSTDLMAALPADLTFSAADAGQHAVTATFKTAGDRALIAADAAQPSSQGLAKVTVSPAAAATLALSGLPASSVAGDRLALTVTAFDAYGNLATGYAGKVHFSSTDASAQLPADFTYGAADTGTHAFGALFTKAAYASIAVADAGGAVTGASSAMSVKHAGAAKVTLEGVPTSVQVDTAVVVTVTVRDAFSNPVTDYAGTLHFLLTDGAATGIPDAVFTAAMQGTTSVTANFATASDQSIIATDSASSSITGSAATKVKHGKAVGYALSGMDANAFAGEPLPLSITAVDAHGNTVKSYPGVAHVSSTDSTDRLPLDGGFSSGNREVSVAYLTAGAHTVTVSEVSGTITATASSTLVTAADAQLFAVTGGSATAGTPTSTTVTARDAYGNTVTNFAGTVALTSSDGQFTPPAPHALTSGTFTFAITFLTSGTQTVTATSGSVSGAASFTVAPVAATSCLVLDTPASAAAGSQVGLRVLVKDQYGNVATGYTGTMAITVPGDTAAQLPANGTFTATDSGTHAFSVQLRTSGSQIVTATDTVLSSLTCGATVNVVPGTTVLVVAFTGLDANLDAWAGAAVAGTVTAQDAFGNRNSAYAGTVAFTSSDAAAVKPANAVFGPSDNGQKPFSVTFNTVGAQTLTATDTTTAAIQGTSKAAAVHGLVYTNPATGGKVRLISNAVSNASVVQLDLVSNASLFPITLGTGDTVRNGAFAAGMNLPLDTTKVGPDTTLLVTVAPAGSTAVLNLGTGTQAKGAAINSTNGVLYSGISQKRVDATATTSGGKRGDVAVRPYPNGSGSSGSFYYSVRLALTAGAAPGTVFDGQALGAKFHAAVRDRSGSDVFAGPDFAIGKLEIR